MSIKEINEVFKNSLPQINSKLSKEVQYTFILSFLTLEMNLLNIYRVKASRYSLVQALNRDHYRHSINGLKSTIRVFSIK